MTSEILIEPLTRIRRDGDLHVRLTNQGKVSGVQLDGSSASFYEEIFLDRNLEHIPRIASRVSGVCSAAHQIASAKAIEVAWGLQIPVAAQKQRELLLNVERYKAYAMHFYVQSIPDFVLHPGSKPEDRNFMQFSATLPEMDGIARKIMAFGQELFEAIGGKPVNPVSNSVGGVRQALSESQRDHFLLALEEQVELTKKTLDTTQKALEGYWDLLKHFSTPTWYLGFTREGVHAIYEGQLRVMDPDGGIADIAPEKYREIIAEHITDHNYSPQCYLKQIGWPKGIYRVNSLAMMNVNDKMDSPLAQEALDMFREKLGRPSHHTFAYHWARAIEMIEAIEKIGRLLKDPDIVERDLGRLMVENIQPKAGGGVGVVAGPWAPVIYELWGTEDSICQKAHLIDDAAQNLPGIEISVDTVARALIDGKLLSKVKMPPNPFGISKVMKNSKSEDLTANLLEMTVRCFGW